VRKIDNAGVRLKRACVSGDQYDPAEDAYNETFFAITLARRFPNPLLKLLVARGDR
jgi:hypothetical protein